MNTVTFKGIPLHLDGEQPARGAAAPDFDLLANDLSQRILKSYHDNILVLLSVPSLDTPVCDTEVRRFNREAANFSDRVRIVAVSCDLPFAQTRWCGAAGVSAVETLSDYRETNFGRNYGVLIRELRLLARAVFVVARDGTLAYGRIVPEITHEPDYDEALAAIQKLV
ncbi:MAG: thiol peroxidase [Desulfovibrio sp.]|jgi:thiol peroxidase|nr:thiol peroxidase [Desulfovibrio sp.]